MRTHTFTRPQTNVCETLRDARTRIHVDEKKKAARDVAASLSLTIFSGGRGAFEMHAAENFQARPEWRWKLA